MRLDPYTLRQAAARWPRETLSPRAAQSFLRSLAEEAEAQRRPASVVALSSDPADRTAAVERVADAIRTEWERRGRSAVWMDLAAAAVTELEQSDRKRL